MTSVLTVGVAAVLGGGGLCWSASGSTTVILRAIRHRRKQKIPTYVSAGGDRIARRKAMWPGAGSNRRPSDFQSDARTN